MATFTITYIGGDEEHVEADALTADGGWARFTRGGREVAVVPQPAVRRIDRAAPAEPPPTGPVFRAVCPAVLAVPAVLGFGVGVVDAFGAPALSLRLFAGVLAALGVAAGLGAVAAWRRALTRACVGALAAAALAALLLLVQVAGGITDARLAVPAAWAVAAGACAWWLRRAGARPRVPRVLEGFLAAGVIVGLFQFWYTNDYVPATQDAPLSVSVQLGKVADAHAAAGMTPVLGIVTVKNDGKSPVRVIGTRYRLRSLTATGDRLLESGDLSFAVGNWLEGGQEASQTSAFFVPSDAGRALRLEIDFSVGRASRFDLSDRPVVCDRRDLGDCGAGGRAWRVKEETVLNDLVRGRRYLRQSLSGDRVSTCFARAGHDLVGEFGEAVGRCDPGLNEVYGNARIGAGAELAL